MADNECKCGKTIVDPMYGYDCSLDDYDLINWAETEADEWCKGRKWFWLGYVAGVAAGATCYLVYYA